MINGKHYLLTFNHKSRDKSKSYCTSEHKYFYKNGDTVTNEV